MNATVQTPDDLGEEFWDERYRLRGDARDGEPNQQLIAEVAELPPGHALDAGTGDGADAIWLAQRGWTVTAVDISQTALRRASTAAETAGADIAHRITWRHADLTRWEPPPAAFDLVSAHFIHMRTPIREVVYRRLAAAVAPGGTLLVVAHHPSDLATTIRRPPDPELFFTARDIAALLEPRAWAVIAEGARPRTVTDAGGEPVLVHDTLLRARRTA